jgi:4-aminobutyrate aminotransferase-like enzyme
MPGHFMLPQPNSYRTVFRKEDGSYDWQTELDYGWDLIDQASCGFLAACIVECIQGDGGIHVLPKGYLQALRMHCDRRGMLLIIDEAQTGMGRTGELFAFTREGVVPDILTLSKPMANGLPLSAVVTSIAINDRCKMKGFLFFTTHTNEPLMAAVGNKTLDVILRDDLPRNARERGRQLLDGLYRLQRKYYFIGDIRGTGLMVGIEIVADRKSKVSDPELAEILAIALFKRGIWCQLQSQKVFRIGPPLNSTSEEIVEGLRILEDAFSAVIRKEYCRI